MAGWAEWKAPLIACLALHALPVGGGKEWQEIQSRLLSPRNEKTCPTFNNQLHANRT